MATTRTTNRSTRSFQAILVVLSLLVVMSLTVSSVSALDTGFYAPKAASTQHKGWVSVAYSFVSDNLYAKDRRTGKALYLKKFTLPAIPAGAVINGITVTVEGHTSGMQADVALTYNNGASYTTAPHSTTFTGTDSVVTLGGPSDTWGHVWGSGDFTDANFGVRLTATGTNGQWIYVDQVLVRVSYAVPASTLTLSPVSGNYGGTASMTATLTQTVGGDGISGETIAFYVGGTGVTDAGACTGTHVGDATTDSNGIATLASADLSGINAGDYPYGACARFAGDSTYTATAISSDLTVVGTATTLVADDATFTYGENVTLGATLTLTGSGNPISGETISFSLFGTPVGTGTTNASGHASLTLTNVSDYNVGTSEDIAANFDSGNNNLNPSFDSAFITINQRPVSATTVTDSKSYDGTTSSVGHPHLTLGTLAGTDVVAFTQTFDTATGGTGKTMMPGGFIDDGNDGGNYNVTWSYDTTGVINKVTLTATADNQTKWVGDPDPTFTLHYSGFVNGETASALTTQPTCGVSVTHTALGSYPITCSGGVSSNYNFSYVAGTLLVDDPNIRINVNGVQRGSYSMPGGTTQSKSYASLLDGPVQVIGPLGQPIFTSQVVASNGSYNEIMGMPVNQFTTDWWFPYYDHGYPSVPGDNMRTWILVGNPSATQTATVNITIGGTLMAGSPFSVLPGNRITPRWIGTVDGPVHVSSNINVFASERVFTVPANSFNEMMGYPANQFTTEYWFPWYDNVNMSTFIKVGNTSTNKQANVDIYIGATKQGSYSIAHGTTLTQSYASIVDGPVRVVSTNGVNVVASEWTLSGTNNSFNEVMGYPFDQFTNEYWFPYYDHGYPSVPGNGMRTWVLVGNPSATLTATVNIYINGTLMAGSPFTVLPGSRVTPRWFGTINGPVHVVSDNPVFTSERVFTVPSNSFNEMMGYPANKLTNEYWFPWYDSINMPNNVLISKP